MLSSHSTTDCAPVSESIFKAWVWVFLYGWVFLCGFEGDGWGGNAEQVCKFYIALTVALLCIWHC
jgi:hypothetical protein